MGVSHDLRTPLSLIKGYTEAIADGVVESPDMVQRSLSIVGDKINQLQEMIDDLIDVAKLDTEEWRQTLSPRAIAPLLRSYAQRLAADGALLRRTVTHRIALPDTLEVPLEERLFIRLLENLAGNALRYTPENGTVHLSADVTEPGSPTEKTRLRIQIADSGKGIVPEDLPYIFEPFYRGTGSRREEGKGLGLSIVKSLTDSFGWTIAVQSEPGAGSVFTLELPVG
jgi:signal transduction histidine kinase